MTNPYLIAHKVRGEPAFDVAIRMECPLCKEEGGTISWGCTECDGLGYWWIIPTSGHRAYPYWSIMLDNIEFEGDGNYSLSEELAKMPPDLPDHYITTAERKVSLAETLGIRPKPTPPIVRRI